MDALLRSALQWLDPVQRIDRFKAHPISTQRTLLRDLLSQAADTEWGRHYGFADIANASDVVAAYQEQVPRHTYDDIKEDVERVREGTSDVMWPGTITDFAVSSGTVSDGKVIPISQETIDHNRAFSVGTGFNYLRRTLDWGFLLGNHLTLPGGVSEDPEYPGTIAGEISGILAENAPDYFRNLFQAVPNEVAFISNWEEKLRTIAEQTVDQDIRLLVMAPTWAIVLFDELINVYNERHSENVNTVGEVWPNLQVFIAGGVPLRSYRDLLETKIGRDVDFIETYGASEGFFSFQEDPSDTSMLLHLDNGVFYEFVRLDEEDQDHPPRCTIADVEPGVRYSLHVTSSSGLWAYEVGDVVQFTSTSPHKITVAGRTSEMIDEYGEALYGDEARAALRHACDETDAHILDYHIAPRAMNNGDRPGHEWLIEFDERPSNLDIFSNLLDEYLQTVNRHYQMRREARAFDAPNISAVPDGTFYTWLKKTKDSISGQTKVPRMSDDRSVADEIRKAMGKKS